MLEMNFFVLVCKEKIILNILMASMKCLHFSMRGEYS